TVSQLLFCCTIKSVMEPQAFTTTETLNLRIPPNRTRLMMKSSPDVESVSVESVICLSKATELFIKELVSSACCEAGEEFTYKLLSDLQSRTPRYAFLADVLPTKITMTEWIEKYKAEFDASCT
ncbi:chromatin accessibility complex protein 1, partial [Paragonimus westermani]